MFRDVASESAKVEDFRNFVQPNVQIQFAFNGLDMSQQTYLKVPFVSHLEEAGNPSHRI